MWEIYEYNSLVRKLSKIPVEVLKRYREMEGYRGDLRPTRAEADKGIS